MSTPHDNPPAFPSTPTDRGGQCSPHEFGMTLRDYFAGQALQGIIWGYSEGATKHAESTANAAYYFADAMLAARSKRDASAEREKRLREALTKFVNTEALPEPYQCAPGFISGAYHGWGSARTRVERILASIPTPPPASLGEQKEGT